MKTAFIFAGQGQQFLYMGQDLCEAFPHVKEIYQRAESIVGYDLLTLDEDALRQTMYTQPALYVLGTVLDGLIKEKGIIPDVVCGLSLGEYNALTSAGALDFEVGLRLICKRATIMQTAFGEGETAMAACLKTSRVVIEEALKGSAVEICNVNTPSQIVIGGYADDVSQMIQTLKVQKIPAVMLKVSTVSHMSLMKPASDKLRQVLEQVEFKTPQIPFINNLNAEMQTEGFVDTLARHISEKTELARSIELMYEAGVRQFIEVGPKGSISKCVKEICGQDVVIKNIYNVETLGV